MSTRYILQIWKFGRYLSKKPKITIIGPHGSVEAFPMSSKATMSYQRMIFISKTDLNVSLIIFAEITFSAKSIPKKLSQQDDTWCLDYSNTLISMVIFICPISDHKCSFWANLFPKIYFLPWCMKFVKWNGIKKSW